MKKLLFFFSLLISLSAQAQYPLTGTQGDGSTLVKSLGAGGAYSGFLWEHSFADTAAANAYTVTGASAGFLMNIAGFVIRCGNEFWVRSIDLQSWIMFAMGNPTDFYSNNGRLSSNRTVSMNGHPLNFTDSAGVANLNLRSTVDETFLNIRSSSDNAGISIQSQDISDPSWITDEAAILQLTNTENGIRVKSTGSFGVSEIFEDGSSIDIMNHNTGNTAVSEMRVYSDSITIKPHLGQLYIDPLDAGSSTLDSVLIKSGKQIKTRAQSAIAALTPYPPAGIPNSTGSAWGTSYSTSGNGATVALNNIPTIDSATFTGLTSAAAVTVTGTSSSGVSAPVTIVGGTGTSAGGLKIGARTASQGALWAAGITPSSSNFSVMTDGTDTWLNSTGTMYFARSVTADIALNSSGHFVPVTTNANDLGATGSRWRNLWLAGDMTATGNATIGGTLGVTGATTVAAVNASGLIAAASGVSFPLGSGTNRDLKLIAGNAGADNFGITYLYPTSGTNVATNLSLCPKGTGFSSSVESQFTLFNTDILTDGTNYEFMSLKAAYTAGYGMYNGKGGTGTLRAIWLDATGTGTSATSNLLLNTDGTSTFHGAIGVTGNITASGSLFGGTSGGVQPNGSGRSSLYSSTNGEFTMYNAAFNGFTQLNFGGIAATNPALRVNSTGIDIKLADNSAYAPLGSGNATVNGATSTAAAFTTYTNGASGLAYVGVDNSANSTLGASAPYALTIRQANATAPISFMAGSGEKVTILSSGNVGIGTTSPTAKLDITATQTATANNQVLGSNLTGTITGRATTSDNVYSSQNTQALVAGANNQNLIAVSLKPSFNDNSKTGVTATVFEVYGRNNEGILKTTTSTGGVDSKVYIGDFNNQGFQCDLIMVRPSGGGTGSTIIQDNNDLTITNTLGSGTNAIALVSSGMTFKVANVTSITGGNVGISTTTPAKLLTIGSLNPVISLKQTTSGKDWHIRNGRGTGTAASDFNIFDSTNNNTVASFNGIQAAFGALGTGITIPSETQLYLYGSTLHAATFDARPNVAAGTGYKFSTIEVEDIDYSNNGRGVAIEAFSAGNGTGTTMGYANDSLSLLRMNNAVTAIVVQSNTPLRVGVNNTEYWDYNTNGSARFRSYGAGSFTGTATKALNVDASGNIIEGPVSVLAQTTDRQTAQTAAVTLAAATVGAADASYLISANVLVTTATLHNFSVTVTYTDEGNTSRTVTMQFSTIAGAFVTAMTNAQGTVPYEGVPLHIRAKAATTITLATTGTFTSVAYNMEESIRQIN